MGEKQRASLSIAPVLWRFLMAMILANISGNMYGPLLPIYLRHLNAGVAEVGLFFSISQVIPLTLQVVGGWISDSVGRLRAVAVGSLVGLAAYFPLILAPSWQWVLLAEGLGAITRSLVAPSFDAFVAEQSSEESRARVFGLVESLFMIVTVIGPLLGGWLVNRFGFRVMLIVAAGFYGAATAIRLSMARQEAQAQEAEAMPLSWQGLKQTLGTVVGMVFSGGVLTWMVITDGVRDASFALSMNLLPIYMQEFGGLGAFEIGLTGSLFGLAVMLTTLPAGWLADKRGERVGIALGFLVVASSLVWLVYAVPVGRAGFFAGWVLAGIGVGLLSPAYRSLISKVLPKEVRGTGFGLLSTSLGLFSLPAPALGAQLWERVSPRFPFLITAGVAYLSVIPVWLMFKAPSSGSTEKAPSASNGMPRLANPSEIPDVEV